MLRPPLWACAWLSHLCSSQHLSCDWTRPSEALGADKDDGTSTDGPCTAERDSLLCVKGTVKTSSK